MPPKGAKASTLVTAACHVAGIIALKLCQCKYSLIVMDQWRVFFLPFLFKGLRLRDCEQNKSIYNSKVFGNEFNNAIIYS
jgi:hypothetical protein